MSKEGRDELEDKYNNIDSSGEYYPIKIHRQTVLDSEGRVLFVINDNVAFYT